MAGIDAAQAAGLKVKLNAVALKGFNEAELPEMLRWAHGRGMDLTVIETMPMGEIDADRTDQYLPLSLLRADLERQFTLTDIPYKTGGPARYVEVAETGGRLGFITPMTHNFCESCNRVRLTCTGTLYMCLGQDDAADLRAPLRASEGNELLSNAIDEAIGRKPKGHDFIIDRRTKPPGRRPPHERHRRLSRPAHRIPPGNGRRHADLRDLSPVRHTVPSSARAAAPLGGFHEKASCISTARTVHDRARRGAVDRRQLHRRGNEPRRLATIPAPPRSRSPAKPPARSTGRLAARPPTASARATTTPSPPPMCSATRSAWSSTR